MTIIPYSPEQHGELVSAWWRSHRGTALQVNMLPPAGVVAVDGHGPCAALWLHLSVGVGVGFLENPVSRPGMRLRESKAAFLLLVEALEAVALTHDYGVMIVHTPPAIARTLAGIGFNFTEKPMLTGTKILR